MPETRFKKLWRVARLVFRWTRILFLFLLFLLVFAVVYLHEVGIPGFIKRPVLQKIHDAGFDVEFSAIAWAWPSRVRFEGATFSQATNSSLKISAAAVRFNLDLSAAAQRDIRINSVSIEGAKLIVPTSETNGHSLILSNINVTARIFKNQKLELDRFVAEFDGAKMEAAGTLTNFLAIQNWPLFYPAKKTASQKGAKTLDRFRTIWNSVRFSTPPEIQVHLSGDAADINTVHIDVQVKSPGEAISQWGTARNFYLNGTYQTGGQDQTNHKANVSLSFSHVTTTNGSANNVKLAAIVTLNSSNEIAAESLVHARRLDVQQVGGRTNVSVVVTNFQWKGQVLASSDLQIRSISGGVHLAAARTAWGDVDDARITLDLSRSSNSATAEPALGFWTAVERWEGTWTIRGHNIARTNLTFETLSAQGDWRMPLLSVRQLNIDLYGGTLESKGDLDVVTRSASATLASTFDVQKIAPLLSSPGQRWLKKFSWEKPPIISAAVKAVLPPWTNRVIDWQKDVLPTVQLNGRVSTQQASYRKVAIAAATTDFSFSQWIWNLPNLHAERPEGNIDLSLRFNKRTGENHWLIDSTIDPKAIKHWFPEKAQSFFDAVQLGGPPTLHATISEHDFDFSSCDVHADILATNVAYRGLHLDRLSTSLVFSNKVLAFSNIELEQGDRLASAPNAEIDFKADKVFLHEAYSTLDPIAVTRAIGRKVAAAIEPYHFHKIPTVYVDGNFVFDHPESADMHFLVDGEDFEWGLLKAKKAKGRVDWIGESLYVTNISAQAYGSGHFEGWVFVNFRSKPGNDFQIGITFTNVDVQPALASLGKTNRLEGLLNGKVNFTAANTKKRDAWEGFGWMQLRNGFIWEVPIFGIFSPMLNAIAPGSGSSRASEASASFVMTNSIIRSDDLEIRSPAVRINYRGTVDFEQNLDAIVEAQIFRDAGSLGHVVSVALQPFTKLFEYKLTGSLDDPKSEPLIIPKFLMKVFRPFHTIKEMFPDKETASDKPQAGELKSQP